MTLSSPISPLRRPELMTGLITGLVALASALWCVTRVQPDASPGALLGLSAVLWSWLTAGLAPAAFMVSAYGYGTLWQRTLADPRQSSSLPPLTTHCLLLSLGAATLLTLLHGANWLGNALGPALDLATTFAIPLAGLALSARFLLESRKSVRPASGGSARVAPTSPATPNQNARHSWLAICAAALLGLPLGVLLVAACLPPGWLWDSEFGAYDALSYHLPLPQEWLASGALRPLNHNVYSYLPSYLESAFLSLAKWTLAPATPHPGELAAGLLAGSAWRALMPQQLHALFALHAAACTAALAQTFLLRWCPNVAGLARHAPWLTAGMYLATPWNVVTGSLAYNEQGQNALLAAALVVAIVPELVSPVRRAMLAAFLLGVAASVKPTALVLGAPAVALALAFSIPPRHYLSAALAAAAAGVLTLSPWLLRNYFSCGNPIFPYAHLWFGPAHWSAGQYTRFAAAHHFEGSLLDRVHLLILPDYTDPARPGTAVHRGLLHAQWALFAPATLLACFLALIASNTRRAAACLLVMLAFTLAAWLLFTHLQSRFLVPVAVLGPVALALAVAAVPRRQVVAWLGVALIASQALLSVALYSRERDGNAALPLLAGPSAFIASELRMPAEASPPANSLPAPTSASTDSIIRSVIALIGDARPFYVPPPLRYNTTWDTWPLLDAMHAHPTAPTAWSATLRDQGVAVVLIDFAEIDRLSRSGYTDPVISPDALAPWISTLRPIRTFGPGRVLFELPPDQPSVAPPFGLDSSSAPLARSPSYPAPLSSPPCP